MNHIPPGDLHLYARSFHNSAKVLAGSFRLDASFLPEADASPVVFMYRHALELHLKTIVRGEGGHFLKAKPDEISVGKSHAVSWLAQFVMQIVTALKWEQQFQCEGVESFADFKAAVEAMSSVDPGSYVFRLPVKSGSKESIQEFARRMDALLELLDATADALAAEWELRKGGIGLDGDGGDGFGPTIQ